MHFTMQKHCLYLFVCIFYMPVTGTSPIGDWMDGGQILLLLYLVHHRIERIGFGVVFQPQSWMSNAEPTQSVKYSEYSIHTITD